MRLGASARSALIQAIVEANPGIFEEVDKMGATAKEILWEVMDRNGWYKERTAQERLEEKRSLARKMLANNESPDKIVEYTGLSPDDIRNLQQLAV